MVKVTQTAGNQALLDPGSNRRIGQADFERGLEFVARRAAGANEGVFGPASAIWRVDREAAVFLGAGRALLMQLAHPWVATAITQHSAVTANPITRFHRTFDIVFSLAFGSLDQALAASRRLHRRHEAVAGTMPKTVGIYPADSRYMANELGALMWVHATLVDTAWTAYELVLPPLGNEVRERYYAECRLLGALFGIPVEAQPCDWPAFTRYVEATIASDRLAVGAPARRIADTVLAGAGRIPVPRWYRDVTAALMPEGLRTAFALPFGLREQARAARALRISRRAYGVLPTRLRYVPPYHEALARVSGQRRPDLLTRTLNRVWIGRPSMGG